MPKTRILVTGGAGYIGSHFVNKFLREVSSGEVIVVDNFSQGRNNIIKNKRVIYKNVDIRDKARLLNLFKKNKIQTVVHFAALASVPDSLINPADYYITNIVGGINLLECMRTTKVNKIICSSSAAIYGEPNVELISENHTAAPINPYGFSKLAFEKILKDYHNAYGISSISFRYFCAAGCDDSLVLGEFHKPETHVIPVILQTLLKKRKEFYVYGNDYNTPDGTGVRDYIHVDDLAYAHILGLKKLARKEKVCLAYNLGIGRGFSVMELIKAAERVVGRKLNYKIKLRRPGDPAVLVADSSSAQKELNWHSRYRDIDSIIRSAYNFLITKR